MPSKTTIPFAGNDEFFIESASAGFTVGANAAAVNESQTKTVVRLYSAGGGTDIRTVAGKPVTDGQMFNLQSARAKVDGPAYIWKIGSATAPAGTTYEDFKKVIENSVLWVKSADGIRYYDNVTADLFNVTVIDPIDQTFIKTNRSAERFWVHPTYFEPETAQTIG